MIAYIHHNPVHHGLVKNLNDWPYSSWHAYVYDKNTKINKVEGMAWFGSREVFEAVHRGLKPEELISVFEQ